MSTTWNVKISELGATTNFSTGDEFVIVQNGETVKIAGNSLASSIATLTNLATRSYVDAIIDLAPETLDTLRELAQAVQDPRRAGYYLNKISGTSQATPQVAGYIACLLQLRPNLNTASIKQFIKDNANKNKLQEGTTAWTNLYSLQGGTNNYLRTPFTNPSRGSITS